MSGDADIAEFDRAEGARHPRDTQVLFGQQAAEMAFLDAYRSGRFPHAWILGGPPGTGKATFAYRAARFVLAHPDPAARDLAGARDLSVPPADPSVRKISAQSHPGLFVLRRRWNPEKKSIPATIPVDSVRHAVQFFGSTAGEGSWRICLVDSLEDLNVFGSNALLKIVEEPPPRCLFLLVAHMPGRVLPTIRSRCRALPFRPLAEADVVRAVEAAAVSPPDADTVRRAAALSGGSVGEAFRILDEETLAVADHVRKTLDLLPAVDWTGLHAMADGVAARSNDALFRALIDTVFDWLSEQTRALAPQGPARLAPLAEVWDKIARAVREADAYNLDRRALVLTLFSDLSDALRAARG